jgi:hypothetical protein
MTVLGALAALALLLLATLGMIWVVVKILNILHRIAPPAPPPVAGDTNNPNQYVFYQSGVQQSGWQPMMANGATQYWTICSGDSTLNSWAPVMGWCGTEDDVYAMLLRILALQREAGLEDTGFWKAVRE